MSNSKSYCLIIFYKWNIISNIRERIATDGGYALMHIYRLIAVVREEGNTVKNEFFTDKFVLTP